MARVVLPTSLGQRYTNGETEFELAAQNVRQLIRLLDEKYPGLGHEIQEANALAIDGEIYQDPFLEEIGPDSEVFVLPKIGGG